MFAGDTPAAVPLAREALALARQTGAPALIATALLEVGVAVAETDPGQARTCLRESRELSAALGYQSAINLIWATAIAFFLGDLAGALELGRRAIHRLQWGADRLRMGTIFYIIAGALTTTRLEAAAIILGAAETYVVESPASAQLISLIVTQALGEERARELRARGAWTGTKPSPTPSPRPAKPSANSHLGPSHERAAASRCGPCLCERPVVRVRDHGGHGLGLTRRSRSTEP